ncbi:MAG: RNA polymerase subunit sigma [Betaproteobacteria bacterium HGW-Betaproteobacteria-16]|nr:MAG: RNA polymerase subunit sigma [Betaproteobacteria bacterium HGW-Betaproteobacteria-16]
MSAKILKAPGSLDGDPQAQEVDPAELTALRGKMVKFASMQLGDQQLAEDAVQEALMGAFKNTAAYAGKATLKTWVFAILKNKITDILRQRQRQHLVSTHQHMEDADEEADLTELFNGRGMWESDERPATWGNPTETLHDKQFWMVFELCLEGLPGQQAKVFMMREYVGLDAREVCAEVGITSTNLNVMLHRARLRLRECLEDRWFARRGATC